MRNIVVALLPVVVVAGMYATMAPAGAAATAETTETTSPDIFLTLSKVADETPVVAGNQIGFTITLTHSGTFTVNDLSVSDTLPTTPGTSWSIDSGGTSGWGSTCGITLGVLTCGGTGTTFDQDGQTAVVHIVSPTTTDTCDPAISTITNTASYYGSPTPGGPVADSSTASLLVTCPPALTLTKVADLSTVSAGDGIGYTITAGNSSQSSIGPVLVSDVLPPNNGLAWTIDPADTDCSITSGTLNCDFDTIAGGGHHSVHIISPTTAATCGTVDNTASAELGAIIYLNRVHRAATTDQEPSVTAEAKVTVLCPDVIITKTPDQYQGVGGKKMSWTITVTNQGLGTAHDVTLVDSPLPPGGPWHADNTHCLPASATTSITCTFGDLASGHSITVHVSGILSSISDCGEIRNTAHVTASNEALSDTYNDTAYADSQVRCPNVKVVKTAEYGTGQHPTRGFSIVVSSTGTGAANKVTLSDPLKKGVHWSITGGNGKSKCKIAKGTLTCSFGTMASGKSFTVHIKATSSTCVVIPNTATVSATNEPSFESGDNTSSATLGCII